MFQGIFTPVITAFKGNGIDYDAQALLVERLIASGVNGILFGGHRRDRFDRERVPDRLTFVAGCTNGYIYYAPTAVQPANRGGAQEDSDCVLAPEWQMLYEETAHALLGRL